MVRPALATVESDIKDLEYRIRYLEKELNRDLRDAARYMDEDEVPYSIKNSIAKQEREIKKLRNKRTRLLKKRETNPMPKKKRKTKRKATAAQLRALARGRATAARNRKKKGPKRKRVTRRRNPAYGNYQKARSVARGSTRKNPVRKLAPLYAIKAGGRYFDGVRFSSKVGNAARFATLAHCKNVAQKVADATGKSCSIVNLRK